MEASQLGLALRGFRLGSKLLALLVDLGPLGVKVGAHSNPLAGHGGIVPKGLVGKVHSGQ